MGFCLKGNKQRLSNWVALALQGESGGLNRSMATQDGPTILWSLLWRKLILFGIPEGAEAHWVLSQLARRLLRNPPFKCIRAGGFTGQARASNYPDLFLKKQLLMCCNTAKMRLYEKAVPNLVHSCIQVGQCSAWAQPAVSRQVLWGPTGWAPVALCGHHCLGKGSQEKNRCCLHWIK